MDYLHYYFDESGNSGSRFLDYQQPFYVEGGWAIEKKNIQSISDAIKKIERTYPFKKDELKGKNLAKNTPGQQLILKLVDEVGKLGGIPTLHICEKRYMVCGKIVETFFDPEYNSKITFKDQWDLEGRQKIAQLFYEADKELVDEFAEGYRAKNHIELRTNAQKWVEYLGSNNENKIAEIIAHGIPNLEENLKDELSVSDDPEFKGIDSLNIPVWFGIFQHIEQNTPSKCSIIHDKIDTFELAYLELFKITKKFI